MATKDNKFVSALRIVVQAELGVKLTQDDAAILANTLTDFFEVLTLIKHKKDCPKKEELEKFLKQKWGGKDKDRTKGGSHD